MATTPEDVRALSIAGEFSHDPPFGDSVIQLRIDRAALFVSTDLWGSAADPAIAALAAHFLVMDGQQGGSPGGPVTSQKVGEVAVTYGGSAPSAESLQMSSYGRLYVELRSLIPTLGTTSFPCGDRVIG